MSRNENDNPVQQENSEWLDAFHAIVHHQGRERASELLSLLGRSATDWGIAQPYSMHTPYRNTISLAEQRPYPGDVYIERQIRSLVRWNAMAMVMRANLKDSSIGGHISSFSSAATLYEVGFNHFFHAPSDTHNGDLVFFQGHSSPGVYARSFLEGRLSVTNLESFRNEALNAQGISSYPHPWLMPDYWQFPTVSMGIGPMHAIYQAFFLQYLNNRGLAEMGNRKVWCFLGDGETDEPESLGSIAMAGREKLHNLIFVVNCNLQRLDGPVRGNGKIIQELEGVFRGAGWNVIKVVWGDQWDPLLERDHTGLLQKRMDECVDGEYQNCKSKGGAYVRENFFGAYPELKEMVAHMSDDDIYRLNRGGHDPVKVFNAYARAAESREKPTVILAKTVKGYGTGQGGESLNTTHSLKKLDLESLKAFRDRFDIPVPDSKLEDLPFYSPDKNSQEYKYLQERRQALGGFVPQRRTQVQVLTTPKLTALETHLQGSGEREMSSTMAFVRILSGLLRDKNIAPYIVPLVPDEARTFGMEGLFRQLGIYTSQGQKYTPEDADQVMYYREDIKGQIIECGINEIGAISAWTAAGTSASVSDRPMIPFYVFYSMFGFQRTGDFCWAAADQQANGFLVGATSGRTTLAGEGLQHLDGHSHMLANTIPNCISYDPAFAYELAVIITKGLEHMYQQGFKGFYYLTIGNENYAHPPMPKGVEQGIIDGLYQFGAYGKKHKLKVKLMGSGAILREVIVAAELLADNFGVGSTVYSATSFNNLVRDMEDCDRQARFVTGKTKPKQSLVARTFTDATPVVAATDYMKSYASRIATHVEGSFTALGTDGFGRSDNRANLRDFFEVNAAHIAYAALVSLHRQGAVKETTLTQARTKLGIQNDRPNPLHA